MAEKPKLRQLYAKPEAAALLEHLAEVETRSLSDQLTVIIREACQARGINIEQVISAAAAEAGNGKNGGGR